MEFTHKMFLWQQTFAVLFSVSNKLQIKGDIALGTLSTRQLMVITLLEDNVEADSLGVSEQNFTNYYREEITLLMI